MNLTQADVYLKLLQINENVKKNLKHKGIAIPKKNADGTISVGRFTIVKKQGFFQILDYNGEELYQNINLPQTAAVIANELAVRHFINLKVLDYDKKYGHAVFEESNQNKLLTCSNLKAEQKDIIRSKIDIVKAKKAYYRSEIELGFKKLISIR